MTEDPRQALDRVARENRTSLASLSRLIDRNAAYIQQHITRGKPALLAPEDRQRIADYFGVDVTLFGPPPKEDSAAEMVRVPRLSVEASAGFGSHADGEFEVGAYGFDQRWLRAVCGARPRDLSIIRVKGDSMTPTLIDGDDVLVDRSDAGTRLRDGLYVLRREDTLMVKRVALAPTARTLTVSSDNPAYPTWSDRPFDSVDVVGRVVWAGRRFG